MRGRSPELATRPERKFLIDSSNNGSANDRRANAALPAAYSQQYLVALRNAELPRASSTVIEALDAGIAPAMVHSKVIAPAMRAIGDLWEKGEINVGEEHVATAITEQVLVGALHRTRMSSYRSRQRIMLAAIQGQHHVLGLRMVADLLEGEGFEVLYLGADVPIDSLRDVAAAKQPALVGLSFGITLNVGVLADSIWAVREGAPKCRLILGGRADLQDSDAFGIPWVSDATELLPTVEKLLSEAPHPLAPALEMMRTPAHAKAGPQTVNGAEPEPMIKVLAELSGEASESAREQFHQAEEFRQLSLKDPLTNLANRRAFDDRIVSHLRSGNADGAIVMIDLDKFKQLNDSLGHEEGDRILRLVGKAIMQSIRSNDTGARIGGDEFALLLAPSSLPAAKAVGERVRQLVNELSCGQITVSVGVAAATGDRRQTMMAADRALYAAKTAGRDSVAIASELEEESIVSAAGPRSEYLSISRLKAPAPRAEELVAAFRERIEFVDNAKGFIGLELLQSDSGEEEMIVVCRWRDREAFKEYMMSESQENSHARIDPELQKEIKLMSLEHLHTYEVIVR